MTLPENLSVLETAYRNVYVICLICLSCLLFICLIRAIKGPRVADRIVAVNMMGTMVMVVIAVMALLLKEGYLVDICIIYAMISFLAVIVLTKVYLGIYRKEKAEQEAMAPDVQAYEEVPENGDIYSDKYKETDIAGNREINRIFHKETVQAAKEADGEAVVLEEMNKEAGSEEEMNPAAEETQGDEAEAVKEGDTRIGGRGNA